MNAEPDAKFASTPKTGRFAVLAAVLRGPGSGASSTRYLVLTVFCISLAAFALTATAASATPPTAFGTAGNDVAVNQSTGDVYIANGRNMRIDVFDSSGKFKRAFGYGVVTGAPNGFGNATAGSKVISSVVTEHGVFTVGEEIEAGGFPAGATITAVGPETLELSVAAVVSFVGVSLQGESTFQVCTSNCESGTQGSAPGQFRIPTGVAVDNSGGPSDGDLYVTEHGGTYRVQKFTPSGEFLLMFGKGVDQGPNHPGNICTAAYIAEGDICGAASKGSGPGELSNSDPPLTVDPSGNVWVGDIERIEQFSPAGSFLSEIAVPGREFIGALALDTDPSSPSFQDFYVTGHNPIKGTYLPGVLKLSPAGALLETLDHAGDPRALGNDPATGDLFVGDQSLGEEAILLSFDSSGAQTAAFGAGQVLGRPVANGLAFGDKAATLYVTDGSSTAQAFTLPAPGPLLREGSVNANPIKTVTATLNATLNPEGAPTEYRFQYGTEAGIYPQETSIAGPLEPVNEIQSLTLQASAGEYRLSFRGNPSAEIPFNAPAAEVQADLEAIAAIGAGNVSVSGAAAGPYAIEFTAALGDSDQRQLEAEPTTLEIGSKPGTVALTTTQLGFSLFDYRSVAVPITGLAAETTYHFRLVAANANGTLESESPDETFTTLPPVEIHEESVSEVSSTSATLNALVNPLGNFTEYRFEYLSEGAYEENLAAEADPFAGAASTADAPIGSSEEDQSASAHIQGLLPQTAYRYRVFAHNAGGPTRGPAEAFTTQGDASLALPDDRQWELVSPANKHSADLTPPGGLIQAAVNGDAIAYLASAPTEESPQGNSNQVQVLSTRGSAGWASRDLALAHEGATGKSLGIGEEYRFFSEDLSRGVVQPFGTFDPLLSAEASEQTAFIHTNFSPGTPDGPCLTSCYRPLVTGAPGFANVPEGTEFGQEGECPNPELYCGPEFFGANTDLSHVVFKAGETSSAPLVEGAPVGSLYLWSAGGLELLSVLPNGQPLVGGEPKFGTDQNIGAQEFRNAISADGTRVVWSEFSGKHHLYLRDTARAETVQLDALTSGSGKGPIEPVFQIASADGSTVFFTDAQQLTVDSGASASHPDLYRCDIVVEAGGDLGCQLTDLTPVLPGEESAAVRGSVLGASEDGSSIYFVAEGALTGPEENGHHETAESGQPNLYLHREGTTSFIAVLSHRDIPDWNGQVNRLVARVSPDGRWLAFMSERPLTGYNNRDASLDRLDEEVFLNDAEPGPNAPSLSCVSCQPTGARPHGVEARGESESIFGGLNPENDWDHSQGLAASLAAGSAFRGDLSLYQPRSLSNGGRLFFNSFDDLVPQDSNRTEDVYEYEPPGRGDCQKSRPTYSVASHGCVSLISSGTSARESIFLDASGSGDDVFFLTSSSLTAQDLDTASDVYTAHVCSAAAPCFPPPPPAVPICEGDACQNPAVPPNHPTPGTSLVHGAGNVHESTKTHKRKAHKKHHKRKGKPRQHHPKRTAGINPGGGK